MSWKMSENPKTLLATKPLVAEFEKMEPVPHDRPLSERRMMVYERILKAGDFRTVVWASVHCYETNCIYRVNGKHTSLMLSRLSILPEFHVTIERYRADTLRDVANLYNTFDSAMASRSVSDINKSFAATVPELREIPLRVINLAVAAAAEEKWAEAELRRVSPAERAEELLDVSDFVVWLNRVLLGGNSTPLRATDKQCGSVLPIRRSPVVRAMLATYRKMPKVATDFWTKVRDETASDRNDPTRLLARYLVRSSLAGGSRSSVGSEKKLVAKREVFVKSLHAWNAWRKGEATSLAYHAKSPLPAVSK